MTARAHAQAVFNLLDADPNLVVYKGEIPDEPAPRYAVLYVTSPLERGRRLSAHHGQVLVTASVLCFGDSPDEVGWVVERVQTRLRRARPVVTGFSTTPMQQATAAQLVPDDSIAPPGWSGTEVWQFTSSGVLT